MATGVGVGLREQKKSATREALQTAALRLALERGPDNVRVDEIAAAAGVSPRTYNNYFSSREQAIVAAVTAERHERVAEAVTAAAADVGLFDAVADAVVDQYTQADEAARDVLGLLSTNPALRTRYADTAEELAEPLAAALLARAPGSDELAMRVLAVSVAAATRLALQSWLRPGSSPSSGLVVPSGSLPDLLRDALSPLRPAFDARDAPSKPTEQVG